MESGAVASFSSSFEPCAWCGGSHHQDVGITAERRHEVPQSLSDGERPAGGKHGGLESVVYRVKPAPDKIDTGHS